MKFKKESLKSRHARLTTWNEKFAWLPIAIDDHVVWFEWYERRANNASFHGKCKMVWEYRIINK
jgi:hypothetical protein